MLPHKRGYSKGGSAKDSALPIGEDSTASFIKIELSSDEAVKNHHRLGLVHLKYKNYDDAIANFSMALSLMAGSNEGQLYGDRGSAYLEKYIHSDKRNKDLLSSALSDLGIALEKNPENVNARINRGRVYCLLRDYKSSNRDYEDAIALAPKNRKAYLGRGQLRMEFEEYRQAIEDFEEARMDSRLSKQANKFIRIIVEKKLAEKRKF